jgi:hypothetical protein
MNENTKLRREEERVREESSAINIGFKSRVELVGLLGVARSGDGNLTCTWLLELSQIWAK